jgi:hypothetical protein
VSILETLTLDGLAFNDATVLSLDSLDMTPPPELEEWVKGADSDGAILARPPKCDNRVITAGIQIEPQASKDLALAKIGLIVDKLKEAQRNANGIALAWTPANATISPITFRCLSGQITGLPIDWQSGWLAEAPLLQVKLTCLPFGEGVEALLGTVTSIDRLVTLELAGVAGDVDALARLVVTESSVTPIHRRYIAWGRESRWYPTSSPPALTLDSASMVTTGFAGASAAAGSAYAGSAIVCIMRRQVQAVCGLGNLTHVGAFRAHLRFYASGKDIAIRLKYQTLDGPFRSLSYKVPVVVGWNHVDLGLITIPQTTLGTQRWTGRIEAYSTAVGGEELDIDVLHLVPAEAFARARATYAYVPGVVAAYDEFTSITAGTVLNARAAPSAGSPTWATSGSTTDYTAADAPAATDETMRRSTTSDSGVGRLARLGATNYSNVEVAVDLWHDEDDGASFYQGLLARYVDSSNYLRVHRNCGTGIVTVYKRVAGVETSLATVQGSQRQATWRTLRVVVFASGRGVVTIIDRDGGALAYAHFSDFVLATGGTLATGLPGIIDQDPSAGAGFVRCFDNFYVATPPAEPVVCHAGQSIEFRGDSTLREDSTGTYAGPPPEAIGARFTLPCAGGPGRKTRIGVITRINDIETAADDDIVASTFMRQITVDVYGKPRYLVVPR